MLFDIIYSRVSLVVYKGLLLRLYFSVSCFLRPKKSIITFQSIHEPHGVVRQGAHKNLVPYT
jgi:hypothetical protein